jgi:hypothetical protein
MANFIKPQHSSDIRHSRIQVTGEKPVKVKRDGNTFHVSQQFDGRDYSGPTSNYVYYGAVELTDAEIKLIESHPERDPYMFLHDIRLPEADTDNGTARWMITLAARNVRGEI